MSNSNAQLVVFQKGKLLWPCHWTWYQQVCKTWQLSSMTMWIKVKQHEISKMSNTIIFIFFFHPFTMLEKHQASLTGFHLSDVNVNTTQTCKKEMNEIIMQKCNHISIINEKQQKDSLMSPEMYQLSPSLCTKVRTRSCARLCPSELQPYKSEPVSYTHLTLPTRSTV